MSRRTILVTCCLFLFLCANGYLLWSEMGHPTPFISSEQGFFRKQYTDPSGKTHNYMVFLPYDYQPGQHRPLLLFLNGLGENGTDGMSAISNNFGIQLWEMKRSFPFVAAIPQCEPGKSWTSGEDIKALAILDQVAKDYETDPDRVYMTGVSSGAAGVWHIARNHPDRFAAIVPICGSPSSSAENVKLFSKAHLPIWSIWNIGDEKPLVKSNRQMHQKFLEIGHSTLATECCANGHDSWNEGYRLMSLYNWLLDQRRSKNAKATESFKLLTSEEILSHWKALGPTQWTVLNKYDLRSKSDGKQPGYLISGTVYRECEFHVDVWLPNTATECQLALVDEVTTPDNPNDKSINNTVQGYTLHLPFAEKGSGGLADSTNGCIAKFDPAAQRQLRAFYWNDLRIAFGDDRIVVYLNGWKAIDSPVSLGKQAFRIALGVPGNSPEILWRNLRLRESKPVISSDNKTSKTTVKESVTP